MFNHYNQLSQNVTKSVYCRITIHLHSCPQLHIVLKKQNDNSGTFRAIATEKCMSHQMAKKSAGSALFSPRARGILFTLSRPKGLRVGPIVEKCAEFRNPFLKKISTELFSEIEIKQGYPLFKISHTNLTPKLYCYQFLS